MEILRKFTLYNIDTFVKEVEDINCHLDKDIVIVAKYETMVTILNALVKKTDLFIENIDLADPKYDLYDDLYFMVIDATNGGIWCDKIKTDDDEYINFISGETIFVNEDMSENTNNFIKIQKEISSISKCSLLNFMIYEDLDEVDSDVDEYVDKDIKMLFI